MKLKKVLLGWLACAMAAGFAFAGCGGNSSSSESYSAEYIGTDGLAYELVTGKDEYRVTGLGSAEVMGIVIPNTYNGKNISYIGAKAFYENEQITSVTIADKVTHIAEEAFYGCKNLQSVWMGDGVTYIGAKAFHYCSSLRSITLGQNITYIGLRAFCNCTALTKIDIPDKVTRIGDYAFAGCQQLKSAVIPASVTILGDYAFYYCRNLSSITYEGTKAQWNALSKGMGWNTEVKATEVVCSDGSVEFPKEDSAQE